MNYIKRILITILGLILITIIFGSLSYFNIINEKILNILQKVLLFVIIYIESYNLGKKKEKKGYIEGIIYGTILILLFIVINIILKRNISIYKLFYYLIILTVSIFSSILGINKKMKD